MFSNHMDTVQLSGIRVIGDKAAALAAKGREIVKLHIGEPDFDTPQHSIDAAIASLKACDTHYAPNRGLLELRRAIAEKLQADNGVRYDPETEILVTTGCASALYCAITGIVDPGEEVIMIEPAFLSYREVTRCAHAVPVVVRAREENGWLPDIEDIRRAITHKTKMLVINSPNNPTGAVYPKALLAQIAKLAVEHNFYVLSDEVYEKLMFDETQHVTIAAAEGMRDRTILVNGFSKAYAMTGWRMGYVAAPRELIVPMLKVHQYTTTCLPVFVQKGALDAITNSANDVEHMRQVYQQRRNLVASCFASCEKISMVLPVATFYMYLNIEKSGLSSDDFAGRLLEEEGVVTIPDTVFDRAGGACIRISLASSEETLCKGAEKICQFMNRL